MTCRTELVSFGRSSKGGCANAKVNAAAPNSLQNVTHTSNQDKMDWGEHP